MVRSKVRILKDDAAWGYHKEIVVADEEAEHGTSQERPRKTLKSTPVTYSYSFGVLMAIGGKLMYYPCSSGSYTHGSVALR